MSVIPPSQGSQGPPSETLGLIVVLVILIVFSAFPVTARAAFWITLFMLCVVTLSLFQSGQASAIGKELVAFGSPKYE